MPRIDISKPNILKIERGLAAELKRLEQENKDLKEFKKEVLKPVCFPNIEEEVTNKYRSALEEIREDLVKLKTNDEDDFTYEYSKIEDKINEALNLS